MSPAGAVIQNPRMLPGFIGRKGCVGGLVSSKLNFIGLTFELFRILPDSEGVRGKRNRWSRGEIR